jgi:5-methylcytosine-specific restriction endonuclease McrBC regulatory subunit McrC
MADEKQKKMDGTKADEKVKAERFDGQVVEVLGATFEEGTPESPDCWREKLRDRKEMLAFLKTADRYWVVKEGFGSEKRKNPA